jgi:predicted Rossmann-fold nucleotide-binding protein
MTTPVLDLGGATAIEQVISKLSGLGVPEEDGEGHRPLDGLRQLAGHLEYLENFYAMMGVPDSEAAKQMRMHVRFNVSSNVMFLLKKYTGKKVLWVGGSARVLENTREFQRIVRVVQAAGPDWIIVHGGGGGIMLAARIGGQAGGSLTVGLKFVREAGINPGEELDHITLHHEEFYSRVYSMLEHADAIVIGLGGLGTLQEKAWAEGCIQCGIHRHIPIFVMCKKSWRFVTLHEQKLIGQGLMSPEDRDLFRLVDDGHEEEIYPRIKDYYAARPDEWAKRCAALGLADAAAAFEAAFPMVASSK